MMDSDQTTVDPFARQLMSRYIRRRQSDISRLRTALASQDFEMIKVSGHNMFGSGAAYGFVEITAIGERLERAAGDQQADAVASIIDELEKYIGDLGGR